MTDRIVTESNPHRRIQLQRIRTYFTMIRKEREKDDKR